MARLAVTFALIFTLFLLSHARIQPNDPEDQNQLVEWKPSTSDTNGLIDSEADPKILLPTQKPLENDVVVSEEISESESTGNAEELPESETTISSIDDDEDLEDDKKEEKHGFLYHFFHKHCHKHHHHHHKNGTKPFHWKRRFFSHFFHKHCHKHHHHHHHHHKNDTKDEEMERTTEKQLELPIAGEETPQGKDMMKRFKPRKGGFLHGKRIHPRYNHVGDGEGRVRFEEGMKKHHHKEWKKEKKHPGVINWFKKFFNHF